MNKRSQQKAVPEPDGHQEVEFCGDLTDYWSYSQIRDYVLLMPGLSHTALRLYMILRSMVTEASRRPRGGLRRMTIDQLCWLVPGTGPKDKPLSVSAMYELLKALETADLVVAKDAREVEGVSGLKGKEKAAKGIARGFTVKDLPPTTYAGWRNAWDKLDAYRPDWRESPPEPPTHLTEIRQGDDGRIEAGVRLVGSDGKPFQKTGTPQVGEDDGPSFQKTGTLFQDSGTPSQNPGTNLAVTSANEAPLRSSLKEALSPPGAGAPSAPSTAAEAETGGEERTASSGKEPPSPTARPDVHDDVRVAEAWIAARKAHGHGVPARARARMVRDAAKLLTEGEDPQYLLAAAADMGKRENWFDLARHLERFVHKAVPAQRPVLPKWCGKCNDGVEPMQPGQRLRETDAGRLVKCECHPGYVPGPVPGLTASASYDDGGARRRPLPPPQSPFGWETHR